MTIRKELEEIVKSGRTAMYKGVFYHTVEELPSESELEEGDEAATKEALDNINRQIEALLVQRESLQPKKEESVKPEEVVAPAEVQEAPVQERTRGTRRG